MADETLQVTIKVNSANAEQKISSLKNSLSGAQISSTMLNKSLSAMGTGTAASGVSSLTKGMTALGEAIGSVGVAVAAVTAALTAFTGALIVNAINVAATGDEIKDQAQKVYLSTTAYQEWGYVLAQNGIEIKSLSTSMRTFSNLVASGDSKLAKYGITATNVSDAFEEAVYNIQNMDSETEKIAAATDLFGNRASELMPMLNMTAADTQNLMATYRMLGGTMSNELIAKSDTLTDSILEMKQAWSGLRNTLAEVFLPILTTVVQWVTTLIAKINIVISTIFELFGWKSSGTYGGAEEATSDISTNIETANDNAEKLKRTLAGFDELNTLTDNSSSSGSTATTTTSDGSSGSGTDSLLSSDRLASLQEFKEKVQEFFSKDYWLEKWDNVKEACSEAWDKIKDAISDKWDDIKDQASDLLDEVKKNVSEKWGKVKEVITDIAFNISAKWSDTKKELKDKWDDLTANIKTKTVSIKTKIATKWADIKEKWSTLMNHFKDKTVNIKTKINATVANLKDWINTNVIDKINEKIHDVKVGGVKVFKSVSIPHLAKGGVLTAPTLNVAGEYAGASTNPEIVTPQNIMRETFNESNDKVVSALYQVANTLVRSIEQNGVTIEGDAQGMFKAVQKQANNYTYRTGKSAFI